MGVLNLDRRETILEILEKSRRGHVGSAFSLVEILYVLFDGVLRYKAAEPHWSERDRFILSKGHGCLALYAELAARHFFPRKELDKFCAFDGILGGHPEYGQIPGIEASTGSLGHGLSIASGMALAGKMDRQPYRVYVVLSDGECNEGSVWEAALFCAKHRLDNLTVLLDYNKMQCYAPTTEVLDLEPLAAKWQDFGFAVREVDGHDETSLRGGLAKLPFTQKQPSILICHTVKGKGFPELEQNPRWHHKARLKDEEMKLLWDCLKQAKRSRA